MLGDLGGIVGDAEAEPRAAVGEGRCHGEGPAEAGVGG